jgi:beta-glucosidase/6-phospho-beta-glucosidase/beta-galactosidase
VSTHKPTLMHPKFGSIFLAGFECATQLRADGVRIDSIAATRHDELCAKDYAKARRYGFRTARDGFRWHLIGKERGKYDWSSIRPMLEAARHEQINVIWDLCHYGIPEWLDIWSDDFPNALADYTAAAAMLIAEQSGRAPMICPVNEISFWAWIGGHEGKVYPGSTERAHELKRQLVRAKLAAIKAAREVEPDTFVLSAEPVIQIVRDTNDEADIRAAQDYHRAQYEAHDLMLGRMEPELGGHMDAIDCIGVNYYPHNQWRIRGGFVPLGHHDYRPFSELLAEVYERYRKPILIAETGAEYGARPAWIYYVCQEARTALANGVPLTGITLYPITHYDGWDNKRACEVGLFCSADAQGHRAVYAPLWAELQRQEQVFAEFYRKGESAIA